MKTIILGMLLLLSFPVFAQNTPWGTTEQLARRAKSNTDADLQALANQTVHTYGVPQVFADQFRAALVQSEKRYRNGGPGVTEEELVQFHNHLVDVFKLPNHSRVDQKQFRILRMELARTEPTAMGDFVTPHGEKDVTKITEVSHTMSPLQAAHLESAMTFQKIANPYFQFAPEDFTDAKGKAANEAATHHGHDVLGNPKADPTAVKGGALVDGITQGVQNLSVVDGLKLIDFTRKTFKLGDNQ